MKYITKIFMIQKFLKSNKDANTNSKRASEWHYLGGRWMASLALFVVKWRCFLMRVERFWPIRSIKFSGNQINKKTWNTYRYYIYTFLDQSKINNINLVKDAASSRRRTSLEFIGNFRRARFFSSFINRWKSFRLGQ